MKRGYAEPPSGFFLSTALELAPRLVGCLLVHSVGGSVRSGVIVEVEAYAHDDPASHAFSGRTARNWPMFERGGLAYVYFIYGMHTCFNVTAAQEGCGEAVLVRALEPVEGLSQMRAARGVEEPRLLASGPGRLCAAMGITLAANGVDLLEGPLRLLIPDRPSGEVVGCSERIGISRAAERPWRFFAAGSEFLSRPSRHAGERVRDPSCG